MFERGKLLGDTRKSLSLATKSGNPIPNEVGADLPDTDVDRWNHLKRKFKSDWKERKSPDGGYNCFGHVWASRRTCIREEKAIKQILWEDVYRIIKENDTLPGDVAIYLRPNDGNILHAARIIGIIEGENYIRTTIVLSKFGEWGGEVIHNVQFVNYGERGTDYNIQFWTDR